MKPLMVHIVDDEPSVRESCEFLVQQLEYHTTQWENGRHFIDNVALHTSAIAIIDLRMPQMPGDEVVLHLKQKRSAIAPIILTGHGDVTMAVKMLKEGAVDFLEKPIAMKRLAEALEAAMPIAYKREKEYHFLTKYRRLTERERVIAAHVFAGHTNREIADLEAISTRTVEVQRSSAMKKMEADTLPDFINRLAIIQELLGRF